MALAAIPPWLNPPDFVGAATRGATLGLQARSQDIQAAEAGDRLKLAYDQLGQKEADEARQAQARLSLAHATLQARKDASDQSAAMRLMSMKNAQELAAEKLGLSRERLADLVKYRDQTTEDRAKAAAAMQLRFDENQELRRQLSEKEPTGTFPLDPNNPFGPKVTGRLSRPEIAPLYKQAMNPPPAPPESPAFELFKPSTWMGSFGGSKPSTATNAPALLPSGGTTNAPSSAYKTPTDVRAAVKSGTLSREQAIEILKSQFGYED